MKKFLFSLIFIAGIFCVAGFTIKYFGQIWDSSKAAQKQLSGAVLQNDISYIEAKEYLVFVENNFADSFDDFEEAKKYAENKKNSLIQRKNKTNYIWDNYAGFLVYTDSENCFEFEEFKEAVDFAKEQDKAYVYFRKDSSLLWTNTEKLKDSHKINNVSAILQTPELPRGCEVTSLAMLINFCGIEVNKNILAEQIKKDNTPFAYKDGKIYYGNPNNGFVGDMYSLTNNGLGVYHKPLYELLREYAPNKAVDITGTDFENLLYFVANNIPVLVITNSLYKPLESSMFETWHTEDGEISVTNKEHSVLVTGYDKDYIYFNDPLGFSSSASAEDFEKAWIQMGRQGITVSNTNSF